MQLQGHLSPLFNPQSIAVVGASATPGKVGHIVVQNLQKAGFAGEIIPVNANGGTILGLPAFRKLTELPKEKLPPDLVVICVPAALVVDVMRDAAAVHARAAIIISAGFKETGGQGAAREEEVKKIAADANMQLLGPNCLGLINTKSKINVTFSASYPKKGNIGFFSQSGALCIALLDWASNENIGFSSFISLGNKARLDESDLLAYLTNDEETKVIVGYLEGIENTARFMQQAQVTTRQKPVIMLRAGSTTAGSKAASSHTGSLAGPDIAYDAAFRQTGIIRARRIEDMFQLSRAFASQPLPKGPSTAILTNAGGPGIIAADAVETAGLSIATFTPATIDKLKSILPSFAAYFNPVDVVGDTKKEILAEAVDTVLADPNVHSFMLLVAPTAVTSTKDIALEVLPILKKYPNKPIFCCIMGGEAEHEAHDLLTESGYPCYFFPEPAIDALKAMYRYNIWKQKPMPVEVGYRRDLAKAQKIIAEAKSSGLLELVEFQAQELFKAYEMPMLKSKLARTSEEAMQIAKQFGQSVALKIASPQISHKTDVGGVILNLDTPNAVKNAFNEITARAKRLRRDAYIAGCLVQNMAPKGSREVIVGFKRDKKFGPLIIFGLGGIHVEVFKDISCRIAPLSLDDVHSMIHGIRAFPILAGMRGEKGVNINALEDVLLIMSQLAQDFPEIQEAECNPVLVSEHGAVVADMRVILSK